MTKLGNGILCAAMITGAASAVAFDTGKPAEGKAAKNTGGAKSDNAPGAAGLLTPPPAGGNAPAGNAPGAAAAKPEKTDFKIVGISAAVPLPARTSNRGSKSKFDFDKLEVGHSIGIIGRTAASLASTISGANRKYMEPKKDSNGAVVYKTQELVGADGTKTVVPTSEPETVATRHFFAFDIENPEADPDKATVRIFRDK